MILFLLLLLPLASGLVSYFVSKGRFNWAELLTHSGAMILIIGVGYYLALCNKTSDTELWNGTVASKEHVNSSCCHSYPCNCREECTSSGKSESCSMHCDTCYLHSYDWTWIATSSNDENLYSNRCNAPGSSPPSAWLSIKIGDPTAVEHEYTNYIKGNPDTIMRRSGAADRFVKELPKYPEVYNYYQADRFITIGVHPNNHAELNQKLSEINGRLGHDKQVNIIVILVTEADSRYLEALRDAWLGGKKNDFIVVVGVPQYPEIAWAGVLSWSRNEDLKVEVRNKLLDMRTLDISAALDMIGDEVRDHFIRRPMADFEYLKDTVEPSTAALWILMIIGILVSAVLQVYFWAEDPFELER